ncbi:MAG: hypothetical protein LBI04_04830, partial [Treponema sp.]|nr:hypothetical protein [Treponema sp.]
MSDKKSRILYIKRFLEENTYENNPTKMQDILTYLEKEGIPASRKTVAQDVSHILESGIDVVCNTGHSHEY